MHPPIHLRQGQKSDAALLLKWRNDPDVIAMSRSQQIVKKQEHAEWLQRVLTPDQDGAYATRIWIAFVGKQPVGMIRLDGLIPIGWPIVSLSVEKGRRLSEQHLGWQMLDAMTGEALRFGAFGLEAIVHLDNLASRRLFVSAGFSCTSELGTTWLRYRKPFTGLHR